MLDTVAAMRVARRDRLKRIADAAVPDDGIDLKRRPETKCVTITEQISYLPVPARPPPISAPRPQCVLELMGNDDAIVTLMLRTKPTTRHIQRAVIDKYGIAIGDLSSVDRRHCVCWPRMISMFLCRKVQGLSLPTIGRMHGNRDHTTALSAINKVLKVAATSPHVIKQVSDILEALRAQDLRVPETVEELFVC